MLLSTRARVLLKRPATGARGFAAKFTPDEFEQKYLAKTYNPDGVRGEPGLVFTHGKGQFLYDSHGREFLDFNAGIAVSGLGHADPDWYHSLVEHGKVGNFVSIGFAAVDEK